MDPKGEDNQKNLDCLNNAKTRLKLNALNAPHFSAAILKCVLGKSFSARSGLEDLFAMTPLSVAKGLQRYAKKNEALIECINIAQKPGEGARSTAPTEIFNSNVVQLGFSAIPGPVGLLPDIESVRFFNLSLPGFRGSPTLDQTLVPQDQALVDDLKLKLAQAENQKDSEQAVLLQVKIRDFRGRRIWKQDLLERAASKV